MARKISQPTHTGPLETLTASGTPPASRLNSPARAKDLADKMIQAGEKRNTNDAAIYGMVSGRPPYSDLDLEKNGQLWRANVNWGIGKAFLEVALTQYWDIITSCPSYC